MVDFRLYANGLACNCQDLIRGRSFFSFFSYLDKITKRGYIFAERGSAMSVSSYVAGIEYEKSDRVSVVIATLTRPTKCNVTPARQ